MIFDVKYRLLIWNVVHLYLCQVEVEPGNTQMLLGCLLLSVQDAAALEEAEHRHSDG